jgi:hypothetical protein
MQSKKPKKNHRKLKIWHIYHFAERFELSGDVRYSPKKPLIYTKSYVGSGTDNESISYGHQLNAIRTSPNRVHLRSAFEELKEVAANRSRAYRGFLLDERLKPASIQRIAKWIGEDLKQNFAGT